MLTSQNIRYMKDRVEVGLGADTFLVLPNPPEGDDYDYALIGKFYGHTIDLSRFLLSARRPQPPEHVVPQRSWETRPVSKP